MYFRLIHQSSEMLDYNSQGITLMKLGGRVKVDFISWHRAHTPVFLMWRFTTIPSGLRTRRLSTSLCFQS